jgi:hypothetical protein
MTAEVQPTKLFLNLILPNLNSFKTPEAQFQRSFTIVLTLLPCYIGQTVGEETLLHVEHVFLL